MDKIVSLRHELHRNAEFSLEEFETKKILMKVLVQEYKIPKECITEYLKTGFTVDIEGTGKEIVTGVKALALRTELDGLPIPEQNPGLPYRSITPNAHMCGHDGHMATLMCTAKVLWDNRHKMASD